MKKVKGLAGAGGKELLPAAILRKETISIQNKKVEDSESEIARFLKIQQEYAGELEHLYLSTLEKEGESAANIFKAYKAIATDTFFFKKPIRKVREENCSIDSAIDQEKEKVSAKFASMQDPYMQERASDIRNVCEELIRRLHGVKNAEDQLQGIREPFVLVADDLSPENTVRIDKTYLRGFITEKGGVTSHAVILAKSLGIPAVVGAAGILAEAADGELIYLDGDRGHAVLNPDDAFIRQFHKEKVLIDQQKKQYDQMAGEPAVTKNGHRVAVCINTGDSESKSSFREELCDGVGLYRTEFLFMNHRDYPDEDTQYQAYREVVEAAKGKEVIIRTLDIGGDKQLDYMNFPQESNPFLGYRAIRLCLDRKEVFLTQLRAILRASAHGNVKIMFPMIVTLEELREAKEVLEAAKTALRCNGIAFQENIPAGIMIETPASVLISHKLAKEADFFSIGTNDLIQYITATDRMNETVQYLYDPCNLSVLHAINTVIQNAHNAGIPAGMCGEAASDERLTPLLLAMGLDEFSVAPAQVGKLKYNIRRFDTDQLCGLVKQVLESDSIEDVKTLLAQWNGETDHETR